MAWQDLLFFASVSFAGMYVYGFAGFASGLLCIPILGLRLEADTYVPAFALCMLLINLRLVYATRGNVQWPHIGWWLVGAAIAAPFGAYLLTKVPTGVITLMVGVLAMALGLMYLSGIKVPIGKNLPTRLGIGAISGFLVAMSGAGGPPVVIYALAREWPKDTFRGSLMAYFMCIGAVVIVMWFLAGLYTREALSYSAVGILPMLVGAAAGTWLKNRTDEARFRKAILWLLILVGAIGVGKGVF